MIEPVSRPVGEELLTSRKRQVRLDEAHPERIGIDECLCFTDGTSAVGWTSEGGDAILPNLHSRHSFDA